MKKIITIIALLSSFSLAQTINDLNVPKPFMGRVSNTNKTENTNRETPKKIMPEIPKQDITDKSDEEISQNKTEVIEAKMQKEDEIPQKAEEEQIQTEEDIKTYADLSLKKLANDISYELEQDSAKTNADLAILWQAVTERSETIKYTIYKLSNPDEDKPDESTIKKILKPIAGFSSLAGASIAGDPYMATGALIGGGLINAFMKDDKEVNYKFSKVSDADMVLLIRKIDDLQKKLLDLYMDYKTKQQLAMMTKKNLQKREQIYANAQGKSNEELIIADVYYRTAKTNAQRAMDEYMTSRTILENLTGSDALEKIEEE